MTEKLIFGAMAEVAKTFSFVIKPRNKVHRILQKIGVMPKFRSIDVFPICFGARSACAKFINKVSTDAYMSNSVFKAGLLISEKESSNVLMFLATVIWNKETSPPNWLIESLKNCTQDEIDSIISFVHESLNTSAFLNSIISMTGVSLQAVEIIAPENESLGLTK